MFDFTTVQRSAPSGPIPDGTIVDTTMVIKPGGYDDEAKGWTGGYAKKGPVTVYLELEFTVAAGEYKGRRFWDKLFLHSDNGPKAAMIGNALAFDIQCSHHHVDPNNMTEKDIEAITPRSLSELDIKNVVVVVGVDDNGRNKIKKVLTPADPAFHEMRPF